MEAISAQKLTLTQSVIDQILAQIKNGSIKEGDTLPSERQLTVMFNVSRSCIREALQALATLGYIDVRSGRRSILKSASINTVVDYAALTVLVEKESLEELFEVRQIFEVEVAGLACLRATTEDLNYIERMLKQYEIAALEQKQTSELDLAFHQALAKAAHNAVMLKMLSSIKHQLRTSRERSEDVAHGGNVRSIEYHKHIFECIKQRDADRARAAMRQHLEDVEERTLANLRIES